MPECPRSCGPSGEFSVVTELPLLGAATAGHSEVCKLLLDSGADLIKVDAGRGFSPFWAAALGIGWDKVGATWRIPSVKLQAHAPGTYAPMPHLHAFTHWGQ